MGLTASLVFNDATEYSITNDPMQYLYDRGARRLARRHRLLDLYLAIHCLLEHAHVNKHTPHCSARSHAPSPMPSRHRGQATQPVS